MRKPSALVEQDDSKSFADASREISGPESPGYVVYVSRLDLREIPLRAWR
jgi:hypothetical protein